MIDARDTVQASPSLGILCVPRVRRESADVVVEMINNLYKGAERQMRDTGED